MTWDRQAERTPGHVDLHEIIYEMIDFRSFTSVWYWIAVAVVWSTASHYILGVPFEMVTRARRHGARAQEDLELMVGVNVRRMTNIYAVAGSWLVAFSFFGLSVLALLAVVYRLEVAQAILLIIGPLSVVRGAGFILAHRLAREQPEGLALCRRMARHRMLVQIVGLLSIFATAAWALFHHMQVRVLY